MRIEFTVPAVPIAQPRQRHRVLQVAGRTIAQNYTPAKAPVNDFKATVRFAASAAYSGPPLTGPIDISIEFVLPRPKRLIWKTRQMPRESHTSKPDIENLVKSVLDALTGTIWSDDAQVCHLLAAKWIASGLEQPQVKVLIYGE
jgi:Holliday junction resolvase RusA-like endonuclease